MKTLFDEHALMPSIYNGELQDLNHRHILINGSIKKPPVSVDFIDEWMREIVEAVNMKILIGPNVTFCETPGNEGITGIVCIETSHMSCHFWHTPKVPFVKFDLYSCKDFDEQKLLKMFNVFEPIELRILLVDRNDGFKILLDEKI